MYLYKHYLDNLIWFYGGKRFYSILLLFTKQNQDKDLNYYLRKDINYFKYITNSYEYIAN